MSETIRRLSTKPSRACRTMRSTTLFLAFLASLSSAYAEDLTLICAGAMHAPIDVLLARRDPSRPPVAARFGTAGAIRDRLAEGERPDVVILPAREADALVAQGMVRDADRHPLGETEIGIAVRRGTPSPDVATPEALRSAIVAAGRVVIVDPTKGTSGGLMMALFDRLGVADVVRAKLVTVDGGYVMETVARGEADLGFQQISEILPVAGVKLVAPLPASLRRATRYDVVVLAVTTHRVEADALVRDFLATDARPVFEARGFTVPR